MNVWLDDKRPMPRGYDVHCLRAAHAIKLLRCGLVKMISLDHDLGDEAEYGTGYHVACAIEELAQARKLRRITVHVHSQNPVGAERMRAALANAEAAWRRIGAAGFDTGS